MPPTRSDLPTDQCRFAATPDNYWPSHFVAETFDYTFPHFSRTRKTDVGQTDKTK